MDIVLIHKGGYGLLETVVAQAKQYNDNVHVISDGVGIKGAQNHRLADYGGGIDDFARYFMYRTGNGYGFELFCFQRWFVLRNFMRKNGVKRCLHLDSDVMVYDNAGNAGLRFASMDFTLSKGHCGHNSFWTLPPLDALADVNMRLFRDKGSDWEWMLSKIGNTILSDMITLEFMRLRCGFSCGDTSIVVEGHTFDHNFYIPQQTFSSYLEKDAGCQMPEWEMSGNDSKKLFWEGSTPFGKLLGEKVRLVTIHCSGSTKQYVPSLFRRK